LTLHTITKMPTKTELKALIAQNKTKQAISKLLVLAKIQA